ncbi:g9347 [Coccomyxa viridis]|uniref:G9347 protein n=1 Tax=Coccomyxa viridis TaxID=1274662 RepID=A0ABP1G9L8_9CHLO
MMIVLFLFILVHIALASPLPTSKPFQGNATAIQVIWKNSTSAFDRSFREAWQHGGNKRIASDLITPLHNLTEQQAFNSVYDVMTTPTLWNPQICDSVWKSPVLESCAKSEPNKTETKLFRGLTEDAQSTVHSALQTAIDRESSNVTNADQVMLARLQSGEQARLKKIDVSLDVIANVQAVAGILAGTTGGITLNPALVAAGGTLLIESQMVALARRKLLGS